MLKDLAFSLSLSNLCFLYVWNKIFSPNQYFFATDPSDINHLIAILVNITIFSSIFYLLLRFKRRCSNNTHVIRLSQFFIFFILTAILTNLFYIYHFERKIYLGAAGILFFLALHALVIKRSFNWYNKSVLMAVNIILILFPLVVVFFSQAVYTAAKCKINSYPEHNIEKNVRNLVDKRLLLLVFDEMDQQAAFDRRPLSVSLPEIDRFKSHSVYASDAYPPGEETLNSMPSLLTGNIFTNAKPVGPDELMLIRYGTNQYFKWSTVPNIFSEINEMGCNTALIGWLLPYSRIIGQDLNSCCWLPHEENRIKTVPENILFQLKISYDKIPFVGKKNIFYNFCYRSESEERKETYQTILEKAKEKAADPNYNLILVHFPVPHPPGFYDRLNKQFVHSFKSGYFDNLALVDNTVGELRDIMESNGLWEDTVVIITSDHWWRTDYWSNLVKFTDEEKKYISGNEIDYRVPFLIKLAGQKEQIVYNRPFNTVLAHDLVLDIFNDEISSPPSVIDWLDKNRGEYKINFENKKD